MPIENPNNYSPQFLRLIQAAESGDIESSYQVGLAFAQGKEVAKDWAKAEYWLSRAAHAGHAPSQFVLGTMYLHCLGGYHTLDEGYFWHDKARKQGIHKSPVGIEVTQEEHEHFLQTRAEEGNADFQLGLAMFYAWQKTDAEGNLDTDIKRAIEWFQTAEANGAENARVEKHKFIRFIGETLAETGDPQHIYALGKLNYFRKDEEPDAGRKAVECLIRASELGNPIACRELAEWYETGELVTRDLQRAEYWRNRANEIEGS